MSPREWATGAVGDWIRTRKNSLYSPPDPALIPSVAVRQGWGMVPFCGCLKKNNSKASHPLPCAWHSGYGSLKNGSIVGVQGGQRGTRLTTEMMVSLAAPVAGLKRGLQLWNGQLQPWMGCAVPAGLAFPGAWATIAPPQQMGPACPGGADRGPCGCLPHRRYTHPLLSTLWL